MEQEIKKIKDASKAIWQSFIALMAILLIVFSGGIIIILLQGGHLIGGKEVLSGAVFPLIIFIAIWISLSKKIKPTPKQKKIIKVMLIAAFILFMTNVLVFWLL